MKTQNDIEKLIKEGWVVLDEVGQEWLAADPNDPNTFVFMGRGDVSDWKDADDDNIISDVLEVPGESGDTTEYQCWYEKNQLVSNPYDEDDLHIIDGYIMRKRNSLSGI